MGTVNGYTMTHKPQVMTTQTTGCNLQTLSDTVIYPEIEDLL